MGSRLEQNSNLIRKRIERHEYTGGEGEEYEASKFGGFADYMRRKKIKLQNLDAVRRKEAEGKPQIFRGITVFVNGYTQPSLNDIHHMVVDHGGGFLQYLDGKTMVTHIVCSNLTPKKRAEFKQYRIVKPAWIVDSIKAGRVLPWENYKVLDEGPNQQVLGAKNGSLAAQVATERSRYRDQTDTSWYTTQIQDLAKALDDKTETVPQFARQHSSGNDQFDLSSMNYRGTNAGKTEDQEAVADDELESPLGEEEILQADEQAAFEERDLQPAEAPVSHSFGSDLEHITEALPLDENISFSSNPMSASQATAKPAQEPELSAREDEPQDYEDMYRPSTAAHLSPTKKPNKTIGQEHEHEEGRDAQGQVIVPRIAKILEDIKPGMTAEEHNAVLLADPRVWKSTVVNPGFLKQYYEESRLHHLSTWKAELKSQLQAISQQRANENNKSQKRPPGARRYIMHVDFDSFFAAVSLLKHPELKDLPCVVAHGSGAGSEIASCNYPARQFGVKNGMWMKSAQALCPGLKVLPYDFRAYEDASRDFYDCILAIGGIVQSVSVDEALVDISKPCIDAGGHEGKGNFEGSQYREQAKADELGNLIRQQIKEKVGCEVSVGIGANILQAKVALRKAKPAGQFQLKPDDVLDFMGTLSVQDLPGVAYSIGSKLEELGIKFVKDVRELSKQKLMDALGPKTGEKLFEYARGIDKTEVGVQPIRKSVSAEVNWGIRFITVEQVDEFLDSLCEELSKRLLNEAVKGKQFALKVMKRAVDAPLDPPKHLGHGKCDTFNRSVVLGVATNSAEVLAKESKVLMRSIGYTPGILRGIGVQMTKLEPLKPLPSGNDSSQKQLNFGAPVRTETRSLPAQDIAAFEDKDRAAARIEDMADHKVHASAKPTAKPNNTLSSPLTVKPSKDISAILGTQFVLPSQVDPEILAQLPEDIRSKLVAQNVPKAPETPKKQRTIPVEPTSTHSAPGYELPSQSQLDPEALAALPPDVRNEIMAHYQRSPSKTKMQAVLPQSPRKARTLRAPPKKLTPTKRRVGIMARNADSNSTLTQANFVTGHFARGDHEGASTTEDEAIEEEFLAALPPDIREEILAERRRSRLKRKSGLDLAVRKRRAPFRQDDTAQHGERKIVLPRRPEKPFFTAQKLSTVQELQRAITTWYEMTNEPVADGSQGDNEPMYPHEDDTTALCEYLVKVVRDERNMSKAADIVRWLDWVVEDGVLSAGKDGRLDDEERHAVWRDVVKTVKEKVNEAVKARGFGELRL